MTEKRGRCNNLEFCSNATAGRIVALPDDAPFVCPKCSEKLEALASAPGRKTGNKGMMIALQAAVIVLGGGVAAYKLLGGTAADTAPPAPVAARATPAPTVSAAAVAMPLQVQLAVAEARAPASTLFGMAGSDVLGSHLARRLAAGYLGLIGDSDLRTDAGPGLVAIVGNQAGEHEQITVAGGGSAAGFAALLRGSADIALSVRPPTKDELASFAGIADLTSPANERVVAVQSILAIVSPSNRLANISTAQLGDILAGRITDWSLLGAGTGPIHLIVQGGRVQDGGTAGDTLASVLLKGSVLTPRARLVATEAELASAIGGDPLAIGLVTGGHEHGTRIVPILTGSGSAILPTEINVATEEYPLTRRLYLYSAAAAGGSPARRFVDYATSPAGQAAVEAAGFTALTVRQAPVAAPSTASGRFRSLVAGASRVSIDFRFQPGSTALDNKSARDVDRLVSFLHTQQADPGRLILAGFADGQGQAAANLSVSQRRVDAVVAALTQAGVAPGHVANFGAELPLADNTTAEGRERNRRVEVYLAP